MKKVRKKAFKNNSHVLAFKVVNLAYDNIFIKLLQGHQKQLK